MSKKPSKTKSQTKSKGDVWLKQAADKTYVNAQEAAELLEVAVPTVRTMVKNGELQPHQHETDKRLMMFDLDAVLELKTVRANRPRVTAADRKEKEARERNVQLARAYRDRGLTVWRVGVELSAGGDQFVGYVPGNVESAALVNAGRHWKVDPSYGKLTVREADQIVDELAEV